MKLNLEVLRDEILSQLKAQGLIVFHGVRRRGDSRPAAYWDAERAPEFSEFLATAQQSGAKMVVFSHLQFSAEMLEDALDQLDEYELPPEERRGFERRLRETGAYQGFTCALEVSYDFQGRTYIYELQAGWYSEFLHILDEIDSYAPDEEEGEQEGPVGGYFSRN
jgi:hypothetical protein